MSSTSLDEVGYLSYSNRHADLPFELVNRRYQRNSTVVTTNRAFAEWGEAFPNAACVVSLIDRLMHRAEVVRIEGDSYRSKEAQERTAKRQAAGPPEEWRGRHNPAHAQGGPLKRPLPAETAAKIIPEHWTPEQALAAWECLHAVREALWALYGLQMQQAWVEQLNPAAPMPDFDPDAPF